MSPVLFFLAHLVVLAYALVGGVHLYIQREAGLFPAAFSLTDDFLGGEEVEVERGATGAGRASCEHGVRAGGGEDCEGGVGIAVLAELVDVVT